MIKNELTKEQMEELLFNSKAVGQGCYGRIVEIDDDTVLKLYYKDISDTYIRKDIDVLDYEVELNKVAEKNMLEMGHIDKTKVETMEDNIKQLEETTSGDLLKGIATYQGQLMGVYMSNYKDYDGLDDIYRRLPKEDQYKVLEEIREKIGDLLRHNIVPTDIKEDNILVRKDDLDVKLIDLDGGETRYETKEYLQEHPGIKQSFIEMYLQMEGRLEGRDILER